ncbi:MAG: acyl-CoA dehydrogenase, partial [Deltaproteobacteria bacterium]
MYDLMESKRSLTEEVKRFVQEMVVDKVKEIEETDEFPWYMAEHFFKKGFLTLLIPKEYGGFGGSIMDFCTVVEEIAKYSASLALLIIVQTVGTLPILLFGTEKQKKTFLEDIARNHRLIGFALTEPKAGSDAGSIQMIAKNNGRSHILNGKKSFVTNGGVSHFYSTFAKTNPRRGKRGLTTFVVPADADGLIVGKKDDKIGMRGIPSTSLSFKDVKVPHFNIIGNKGEGFRIAMETLNRSRPAIAAQAVGIAEAALEYAILFAMKRRQFGKPIAKLEGMQFILAD